MDAPTVKIGKIEATLVAPPPLTVIALSRTEEEFAAMPTPAKIALGAAALAECWPQNVTWPGRPRIRKWKPLRAIEDHGADAYNSLVGNGVAFSEVMGAGPVALGWALSTAITEDEVAAAEGNSEAPTGG